MNLRRWLRPGMGIKRWLVVVFLGLLALALAGAFLLRQFYRDIEVEGPLQDVVSLVTLQFLPYAARGAILVGVGLTLFIFGWYRVIGALLAPLRSDERDQPLVEVIYQKRFLARGPRVVAIGGGTGLSTLLRGLKEHTSNITAIVTVADDGGSSGVLRQELGIPPVGDIRNCIVALADAEPLMGKLLQYRFPVSTLVADETPAPVPAPAADGSLQPADDHPVVTANVGALGGHAVGNLLIAAMVSLESGDFEDAVREMNRVLAVRGQVVPASPRPLTLNARLDDGTVVIGQSKVARATGIEEVWLTPGDVRASEEAITAINEADLIVIGPGSLYTSILPSLLIPEIRAAVLASPALRVYACNVATQRGETQGFDLADHVEALERHTAAQLIDVVLANNHFGARVPETWAGEVVRLRWPTASASPPKLVLDDVVDPENAHHHDSARLSAALIRLLDRAELRRRPGSVRSA